MFDLIIFLLKAVFWLGGMVLFFYIGMNTISFIVYDLIMEVKDRNE